ncbi:MAG: hypothetical protein ACREQ9_20865, partial [Candidatus Binatia bacterium]
MGAEAENLVFASDHTCEETGREALGRPVAVLGVGRGGVRLLEDVHRRNDTFGLGFLALDTTCPDRTKSSLRDRVPLYRAGKDGFRLFLSCVDVTKALQEHGAAIEEGMRDSRLVIILACLGDLAEGYLSVHVAGIARATGALAVVFAVMPSELEGSIRTGLAADDLRSLSEKAHTVIAVSSDLVYNWSCRGWSSEVIRLAIEAVSHPFAGPSANLLRVRPPDLWRHFSCGGIGALDVHKGYASGLQRLLGETIRGRALRGRSRLWVHIEVGPAICCDDVLIALRTMCETAGPEADVVCSVVADPTVADGWVKVAVIGSGGLLPPTQRKPEASDAFGGWVSEAVAEERAQQLLEKVLLAQAERYRKEGYVLVP